MLENPFYHNEDAKAERRWLRNLWLTFCGICGLGLFLLALGGCASHSYDDPRATVHIIQVGEGNGSGVMIAPFLMLTAAHVVGDMKNLTVGPKKLPAKLLYKDEANDIALLHVAIACPCAPLATPPAADVAVIVVGYPVNQQVGVQVVTEGLIQGVKGNRLAMTAPAAGGNSGGGVFVYQYGQWKLAGILVEVTGWCMGGFACFPMPHLSRAVSTEVMTRFLEASKEVG
jgi:hypothetical protein